MDFSIADDTPVDGAQIVVYVRHFHRLSQEMTRPEAERRHLLNNALVCAELLRARVEIENLTTTVREYDRCINWHVTCSGCADALDKSYLDYERIRELKNVLSELLYLKDVAKETDPQDYERRKPLAWEAAREVMERG